MKGGWAFSFSQVSQFQIFASTCATCFSLMANGPYSHYVIFTYFSKMK